MDRRDKTEPKQPHQLIMQDRRCLEMGGVSDVQSFDDRVVKAYTSFGELTINGSGLHIKHLDLDHGSFSLEGTVDSLVYSDVTRGGFLGRLFR